MESGIYKITCTGDGKFYIGSAISIRRRWIQHKHRLKNRKHENQHLQNAYNKYGVSSFEYYILENCEPDQCIIREQFYIDTLKPEFNIARIAGSALGVKRSPETRRKMSIAKSKPRPNSPVPSVDHRRKISISLSGRILSEEHKQHIIDAKKGKSRMSREEINERVRNKYAVKRKNEQLERNKRLMERMKEYEDQFLDE